MVPLEVSAASRQIDAHAQRWFKFGLNQLTSDLKTYLLFEENTMHADSQSEREERVWTYLKALQFLCRRRADAQRRSACL